MAVVVMLAWPIDPKVAAVRRRYREAVAQATELAIRELEDLGVDPQQIRFGRDGL